MAGIKDIFANNPIYNVFGLVSGSVTNIQLPSGTCKLLRFKAHENNIGIFFIGDEQNVIWPLGAGDDTGWIAAPSDYAGLANFWYNNASGSTEQLIYWMQK